MLRLVEWFWTFQGEGYHWGRRALFVRVPFCNLTCSWCDTEFNKFEKITEEDFIEFAKAEPTRFAVLTGGEPMLNKQSPRIVEILKSLGFEIACESNGTAAIIDGIDFVTISPKREADYKIHADAAMKANEVKIVVDDGFDFDVCRNIQDQDWTKLVRLSLSPEFGNFNQSIKRIEDFIKENPRWRISLQTHKWIGVR